MAVRRITIQSFPPSQLPSVQKVLVQKYSKIDAAVVELFSSPHGSSRYFIETSSSDSDENFIIRMIKTQNPPETIVSKISDLLFPRIAVRLLSASQLLDVREQYFRLFQFAHQPADRVQDQPLVRVDLPEHDPVLNQLDRLIDGKLSAAAQSQLGVATAGSASPRTLARQHQVVASGGTVTPALPQPARLLLRQAAVVTSPPPSSPV